MGVLVIDAEGYYGDFAMVYAAADSREQLPGKWRKPGRNYRIVEDGGYPREVGTKIHRQFAPSYKSA
jgi:hypothetical protein